MNNSQTIAEYSARVHAAWVARDPSKDYWTVPGDIIALIIDDMVAELPESIMLKMAGLNGFATIDDLVLSLKTQEA